MSTSLAQRVLASHSLLVEEALDDHDMLKHYENGADLVQDWPAKRVKPPAETASFLKSIVSNCIVRNVAVCDGCGVSSRGVDDGADCNERPSHRRLSGILFSVLSAIVIR